jgi:hypothetical protein
MTRDVSLLGQCRQALLLRLKILADGKGGPCKAEMTDWQIEIGRAIQRAISFRGWSVMRLRRTTSAAPSLKPTLGLKSLPRPASNRQNLKRNILSQHDDGHTRDRKDSRTGL